MPSAKKPAQEHREGVKESLRDDKDRTVQRVQLLSEAARDLLRVDAPVDVLDRTYNRLADSFSLDLYFHFDADDSGKCLTLRAWRGIPPEAAREIQRLEFGEAVCGRVAQDLKPIVITDVQNSRERFTGFIRKHGITAYVCHPLVTGDRLLGTVSFGSRQSGTLPPDVIETIRILSDMLAAASARRRAEQTLDARVRQQRTVAELGLEALRQDDLQKIFDRAVADVARTLDVELCKILELLPGGDQVLLRAGVGWKDGLVGHAMVSTGQDSQAGYTLAAGKPVIVEDLRTETRFRGPPLLRDHGVVSGLSCTIMGAENRPWGVLGAHCKLLRRFTEDDVAFLQTVANVLASSIERKRTHDTLRETEERVRQQFAELEAIYRSAPLGLCVLDRELRYRRINQRLAEINGLSLEDHLGKTVREVVPSISDQAEEVWRRVLDSGEAQRFEFRGETPAQPGVERIWDEHWYPLRDTAGRIIGVGIVADEVTERRRAEEALRESEALLQKALSIETVGVLFFNLNGRMTEANRAFARMSGYARDELLNILHWEILTPPEFMDVTARAAEELATRGETAPYEKQLIRKDGSRWWGLFAPTRLRGGGRDSECVEFVIDITERKRAEEARRKAEERFRKIYEHAGTGIAITDWQGRFLQCNRAYSEIVGYTEEELRRVTFSDLVHPEDRDENMVHIRRLMAGEFESFEIENRYVRKGGEPMWVQKFVSIFRDETGAPAYLVALVTDITERRRAHEALRESEGRLRLFIEHAPAAIAMFDREMRYLAVSNRWQQDYNLTENPVGRSHREVFPEIPERWKEVHRRGLAGEVLSADEDPFPRADGTVQWIKWEVRPWYLASGEIGGILIAAEDVTRRVLAKQALLESEERFRALAENIPHLAWMTDAQGWIFWYNRRWFDYTGTTLEQMQGWGWEAVHHPDHIERVKNRWRSALASGEPWEDTFPLRGKDGQYRWFLSRAFPMRDAHGHITHWFGSNTDVHELRETQKALHEAQQQLQERAADLERLVNERTANLQETIAELESVSYSLSHDMRAPLRTIQSFTQIVLAEAGDKLGPQQRVLLEKTISSAARMDRLIQDVLIYSRVSRQSVTLTAVDVEKLIKQIVTERAELQPPGAEIRVEGPLPPVRGHEAYLTQCITNLLDNAVKFVAPGTQPRVRVWAEADDHHVLLWFEDNGIGIPRESQQRIFGMFQRMHGDHSYPGTGIGLAIVRRAAERMGGSVGVESEPGRGSRFWLRLSRANAGQ